MAIAICVIAIIVLCYIINRLLSSLRSEQSKHDSTRFVVAQLQQTNQGLRDTIEQQSTKLAEQAELISNMRREAHE